MPAHVLTVPGWRPATLNELLHAHWGTAAKLKRLDRQFVALYARQCGIPKAIGKRRVSLVLTYAKGERRCDPDAFHKSCLDALKHAGLLVNDSPAWCELGPVRYARGPARATEIRLEDLS